MTTNRPEILELGGVRFLRSEDGSLMALGTTQDDEDSNLIYRWVEKVFETFFIILTDDDS